MREKCIVNVARKIFNKKNENEESNEKKHSTFKEKRNHSSSLNPNESLLKQT